MATSTTIPSTRCLWMDYWCAMAGYASLRMVTLESIMMAMQGRGGRDHSLMSGTAFPERKAFAWLIIHSIASLLLWTEKVRPFFWVYEQIAHNLDGHGSAEVIAHSCHVERNRRLGHHHSHFLSFAFSPLSNQKQEKRWYTTAHAIRLL